MYHATLCKLSDNSTLLNILGKNVKRCKAEMSEISEQLTVLHNNQATLVCMLLECHKKAVSIKVSACVYVGGPYKDTLRLLHFIQ